MHLHGVPRVGKFIETESRTVITREELEIWLSGYRLSIGNDEKVLEMESTADCTALYCAFYCTCTMYLMPLNCTVLNG